MQSLFFINKEMARAGLGFYTKTITKYCVIIKKTGQLAADYLYVVCLTFL